MIKLYDASFTTTYVDTAGYNVPTDWDLTFLIILPDAVSCKVMEERNGKYELELVYAANGLQRSTRNYWLAVDKILEVDCPLRDSIGRNLFRIYRVTNGLDGLIYVYARQLSTDLSYYVANNSGSPVMGGITVFADSGVAHGYGYNLRVIANDDLPFAFGGDAEYDTSITGVGFHQDWSSCTSIRSYLGGEELTGYDRNALQRFGGEYEFDRFNVNLWEERGQTRPVTITYGTNLAGIDADDDIDDVYTAVVAFAVVTDGINYKKYCSSVIDTSYVSLFPYKRIKTIDVSSELMEQYPDGIPSTISGWLNKKARAYVAAHNNDGNPLRKVTVDVVESELNDVYLCDTVKVVYHKDKLNVDADMKITAYEWDVLRQRYTTLTLGPITTSLAKEIIDAGGKSDIIALQNVAASTQNAIQELQSKYVAKAGDTMTGSLNIKDDAFPVSAPSVNYTDGSRLEFSDQNDAKIGYVQPIYTTSGLRGVELAAMRRVGGTSYWNALQLLIDNSGAAAVSLNQVNAWRRMLGLETTHIQLTLAQTQVQSIINGSVVGWAAFVSKTLNVVTIMFNFIGTNSITDSNAHTIYTLPAGYRPVRNMYSIETRQNGTPYILIITATGAVQINMAGAAAQQAAYRFITTFVTA